MSLISVKALTVQLTDAVVPWGAVALTRNCTVANVTGAVVLSLPFTTVLACSRDVIPNVWAFGACVVMLHCAGAVTVPMVRPVPTASSNVKVEMA